MCDEQVCTSQKKKKTLMKMVLLSNVRHGNGQIAKKGLHKDRTEAIIEF